MLHFINPEFTFDAIHVIKLHKSATEYCTFRNAHVLKSTGVESKWDGIKIETSDLSESFPFSAVRSASAVDETLIIVINFDLIPR